MRMYRVDHTGPNTELGGFQLGFASDAYHSPGMNLDPTQPAAIETTIQRIKPTTEFLISKILLAG
jgi:hypothetical protein